MTDLDLSRARIAVIGSGTMGIGIAQLAIVNGHSTVLYDLDAQKAQQAAQGLGQTFKKLVEKSKLTQQQADEALARLTVVNQIEALRDADLVIEAVIEKKEVKQSLFKQLAEICSAQTIFASNTSSISVTAISAGIAHPERVVGLHFFNPAPVMKLVEIVQGLKTPNSLCLALKNLMVNWKKIPVLTKSTPGFIVNRIARPFYAEGFRALQEQVTSYDQLDYALKQCGGFAMGPCELTDLIGQDVNFSVTQSVYQEFFYEPRYRPSLIQKELVDAGAWGRKSKQGFYRYNEKNQYETFQPQAVTVKPVDAHIQLKGTWSQLPAFLTRLGLKSGSASDDNILQIDDIDLRLSQGESANIHYLSRKVVLMDWHHDFEQAQALVLSHNELCEASDLAKVEAYFAQFGMSVMWIKDHPALLTLRTIALLINEACEASLHGVASLEDIDNAMKYGVNYPKGPYQWLTQMGGAYVLQTLNNLYALYGEEKYRASIYLKQYVAKTQNIATQYSRDMTEFA
ncbi:MULTISPECIES: 3-hydroxyacyl-CoA dehydrogenase [Acinetobacter]|uniref:3-hydroxyacyl-CoA dehydrogenase n=1 Tax=Acinetobacter TaxID=469 RepID=UPI0002DC2384|nr:MULTISPECIES: 3-hydroxyacyl-CoA dehydrogenase [Acinetobacter]AMM29150.1 3-hydroxyacyl-CoA dehydrogenase [Acinetobacter pittii]MCG9486871.1 3-hydroxyacyl-CoA dehydrogenase [Acinetobacter pittii]OCY57035.1 3-hydroxyacyl-CoA dehydrogenase [Acinetobacter pittii]OCZ03929.1 3-hydroxyacyl-CoA dehydrogenase [Acinetobacter pittii]RSO61423.1 3-hydroxyacyl-CoA dehydrogenase [Acinetobacter pittii]